MKTYELRFSREAAKDVGKLTPKLKEKLKDILRNQVAAQPYAGKKLTGDLSGFYSVRLSYADLIVYTVDENAGVAYVHRARTHYGD